MCVTNTTNRRAVALAAAKISLPPSSFLLKPVTAIPTPSSTSGATECATTVTRTATSDEGIPTPANSNTEQATRSMGLPSCISALHDEPSGLSFPYDSHYEEAQQKRRAKRRRKPQKPGKTAKLYDRHFVKHNYHDHANDRPADVVVEEVPKTKRRGGVTMSFPNKLHDMLEQSELDGMSHIISWQPHGRCFLIHKPKEFASVVMPKYFRQSKLTSFQRQLNLYGFQRLTRGPDDGGYYHELFLRGKSFLTKMMYRTKVNGRKFKAASSPDQEPDFYKMPAVCSSAEDSNCDTSTGDCGATVTSDSDHTCSSSEMRCTDDTDMFQSSTTYPCLSVDSGRTLNIKCEDDASSTVSPVSLDDGSFGTQIPSMIESSGTTRTPVMIHTEVNSSAPSPSLDEVVDDVFFHEDEQCSEDLLSFVEDWDYQMEDASGSGAVDAENNFDRLLERYLDDVVGGDCDVPV